MIIITIRWSWIRIMLESRRDEVKASDLWRNTIGSEIKRRVNPSASASSRCRSNPSSFRAWAEGDAPWSSGAFRGARRPSRRSGRGRCPACPTRPPPSTRFWTTSQTKQRHSWSVQGCGSSGALTPCHAMSRPVTLWPCRVLRSSRLALSCLFGAWKSCGISSPFSLHWTLCFFFTFSTL